MIYVRICGIVLFAYFLKESDEMKERWDAYDIDRHLTGRSYFRGEKGENGDCRMVIHVCIFNSKGEMLIQQRQPWKSWGEYWDITVGGCAVTGETSRDAAHRELFEELGLDVDFAGVRPHFTINFDGGFDDMYILNMDVDLSSLRLQPEEVKAVRWAKEDDVLALIDEKKFIPFFKTLISHMFAARNKFDGLNI